MLEFRQGSSWITFQRRTEDLQGRYVWSSAEDGHLEGQTSSSLWYYAIQSTFLDSLIWEEVLIPSLLESSNPSRLHGQNCFRVRKNSRKSLRIWSHV